MMEPNELFCMARDFFYGDKNVDAYKMEDMMEEHKLFDMARDFFYGDENVDAYKMEDELISSGVDVDLVWELLDELLWNAVKAAIVPKFPENRMNTVKDVVMPTE